MNFDACWKPYKDKFDKTNLCVKLLCRDWSEFLAKASDAVTKNLLDVEEARLRSINPTYKHIPA